MACVRILVPVTNTHTLSRRVSNKRVSMHDSRETKQGCTTCFWCSQDEQRKHRARPSEKEGVKHRDTLGLHRFACESDLCISCVISSPTSQQITVRVSHSIHHTPYFDVLVPKEVVEMVRRDIDWALPNDLTRKIQQDYPAVTNKQIMTIWTKLVQELWKRKPENQMESATILLKESDNVTDLFVLEVEECHDFHRFSSFFTLSPRRSHSFRSTMTYFSFYLILSYLSFSLSYLLRSHDQDGKHDLIGNDYLQFRAIPKITTRTSRSMDPLSGDVPRSQELPVPPDRLYRIQLLPGEHPRRRTPQSVWRPKLYRSPDSSLVLLPR